MKYWLYYNITIKQLTITCVSGIQNLVYGMLLLNLPFREILSIFIEIISEIISTMDVSVFIYFGHNWLILMYGNTSS